MLFATAALVLQFYLKLTGRLETKRPSASERPDMPSCRSQSRSPRRAVASDWRPGGRALRDALAEFPLADVGFLPWLGYPGAPAPGDGLGVLRWCLLARGQPPGQRFARTPWTAAERGAAFANVTALCYEPLPVAGVAQLDDAAPPSAAHAVSAVAAAQLDETAAPSREAERAKTAQSIEESVASSGDECGSDCEFEGAREERASVRREEAARYRDALAQMQTLWSEAAAETVRLRSVWDRLKARESVDRRAATRSDVLPSLRRSLLSREQFFAERELFLREEAACEDAEARERARWSLRLQLKIEEVARALCATDATDAR